MIDRPHRPGPRGDRPGGFTPRPGFPPRGDVRRPFGPPPAPVEPSHSVRLRDGEREVEVHGSAAFVRQALEDLPVLMARLRGEKPPRPTSISMPPAPAEPVGTGDEPTPRGDTADGSVDDARRGGQRAHHAPGAREDGGGSRPSDAAPPTGAPDGEALESQVLSLVRRSRMPIGIAEIRRRLGTAVSGQQVRRILERNADSVVSTGGRPAAYRARQ